MESSNVHSKLCLETARRRQKLVDPPCGVICAERSRFQRLVSPVVCSCLQSPYEYVYLHVRVQNQFFVSEKPRTLRKPSSKKLPILRF